MFDLAFKLCADPECKLMQMYLAIALHNDT